MEAIDAIGAYLQRIQEILETVQHTQDEAMRLAARKLCEATLQGRNIFTFGCGHASLLALEMYYRSGGMVNINPIRAPGLNLDVDPATLTSAMERLPEYGRLIIDSQPLGAGDLLIIHSVSGRNVVTVDAALRAREKGAYVIALTSLASAQLASRHPSGLSLHQAADLVLDNCGVLGDAVLDIPGAPEKVAPASTTVGAAILNAVMAQAVAYIVASGGEAPVFISSNRDGGDAYNRRLLQKYRENIFYMGR